MLKLASVLIFITTLSVAQPKLGIWRGVLLLNPEKQIELPFNFEIKNNPNYKIVVCKKFVKLCKIFMLKATEFVFGYNS